MYYNDCFFKYNLLSLFANPAVVAWEQPTNDISKPATSSNQTNRNVESLEDPKLPTKH